MPAAPTGGGSASSASTPTAPVKTESKTGATEPKVDSAGRVHGADGKFTAKPEGVTSDAAPGTQPAAPQRPPRPSTWAKDYWDHWDQIDPKLANYLHQREGEYARGVSTYKQEWDRAKPVLEALHPYQEMMQAANITPQQFIQSLAGTHQVLSGQDREAAKRAFVRFAQDYKIPMHELFVQGEDGKVYFNQTYFQQQEPAKPQGITADDVGKLVNKALAVEQLKQAVVNFTTERDHLGNPKYPHFQQVRQEMDGLLRASLAKDLPTAYDIALRMPQHAALYAQSQETLRKADEEAQAKATREAAERARANTVSPRNEAPQQLAHGKPNGTGLRATLEAAANAHLGGGRV